MRAKLLSNDKEMFSYEMCYGTNVVFQVRLVRIEGIKIKICIYKIEM